MANTGSDQWTEDKCLKLIREYRARPVLWDQKDPFYFKKTLKPKAWREIAAAINISADQCRHKMIILMSSFRREKAKIMHSLKTFTDPSLVYKSTWFAFKDMAFLLDKESERKRQLNDSDDEDEEDSAANIKLKLLSHHLDIPVRPAKKSKKSLSDTTQMAACTGPENTTSPAQTAPQLQPRPGPSQTLLERDEEIKSFTSFIGNKMKKYSDTTKNAVQQAICDIIFKADQNNYERNSFEKFTIIDDEHDPLLDDNTVIKIQNDLDCDKLLIPLS